MCGKCEQICPMGIEIPDITRRIRSLREGEHVPGILYKGLAAALATGNNLSLPKEDFIFILEDVAEEIAEEPGFEGFSVPKLEERVKDLTEQQIFNPHMVIIDGLPFDEHLREPLEGLKSFSESHRLHLWFTVTTHRHEAPDAEGLPVQLSSVADLFDAAIQLQPEGKKIHIRGLKGGPVEGETRDQLLDPSTMLIQEPK